MRLHDVMLSVGSVLGAAWGQLAPVLGAIVSSDGFLPVVIGTALGGLVGWLVVSFALLEPPFNGVVFLLYLGGAPTAALLAIRRNALGQAVMLSLLWCAAFMIGTRILFDLISLPPGELRNAGTAYMGFVAALAGLVRHLRRS